MVAHECHNMLKTHALMISHRIADKADFACFVLAYPECQVPTAIYLPLPNVTQIANVNVRYSGYSETWARLLHFLHLGSSIARQSSQSRHLDRIRMTVCTACALITYQIPMRNSLSSQSTAWEGIVTPNTGSIQPMQRSLMYMMKPKPLVK